MFYGHPQSKYQAFLDSYQYQSLAKIHPCIHQRSFFHPLYKINQLFQLTRSFNHDIQQYFYELILFKFLIVFVINPIVQQSHLLSMQQINLLWLDEKHHHKQCQYGLWSFTTILYTCSLLRQVTILHHLYPTQLLAYFQLSAQYEFLQYYNEYFSQNYHQRLLQFQSYSYFYSFHQNPKAQHDNQAHQQLVQYLLDQLQHKLQLFYAHLILRMNRQGSLISKNSFNPFWIFRFENIEAILHIFSFYLAIILKNQFLNKPFLKVQSYYENIIIRESCIYDQFIRNFQQCIINLKLLQFFFLSQTLTFCFLWLFILSVNFDLYQVNNKYPSYIILKANMIKEPDHLIKLILIGSSGVGKSSILMQFAQNRFTENYLTTIGVDFRFKTIKHGDRTIKLQIWDTAGQQRFRTITGTYYKGADGIMMVYDVTQPSSLEDIKDFWIPQAYNYCDKSVDVLLLGNKCDCTSERRITTQKGQAVAEKNSYKFEEVSAKTAEKIQQSIKTFATRIVDRKFPKSSNDTPLTVNTIQKKPQQITQEKQVETKPKEVKPAPIHLTNPNNQRVAPKYKKSCC